jgi:glycosyltransferase involved in cell wall biosynthesis
MSDSSPLVSIIVPCYNYGRYLPECLNSIFAQAGGVPLEVIAIDDAAVDNSREILENCRDPRLRIITHEKNQGHAAAVTHGFEAARGKYAARIDPDDRYRPNFLATLVPVLETHPEVGMAYGDASMIDSDGAQTAPALDTVHGGRDYVGNELVALMQHHFICAPTALARTEAWRGSLPIPSHLAFNDIWFNWTMAREWDYCYKNVVVADYRVHAMNWHSRISRDGSEEKSILWLLDKIYSTPEKSAELERAKQRARSQVYGWQWLGFARRYFGAGMEADSRRCFLEALRADPRTIFRDRVIPHFLGTVVGLKNYNAAKALLKS